MLAKITATFPSGVTVTGTVEEIKQVAKALGVAYDPYPADKYHFSETKNDYILIKDMATPYLKNVLLKLYTEWVNSLYKITSPKDICRTMINGNSDPHFEAIFREFAKRD